jgi:hypothetical protein
MREPRERGPGSVIGERAGRVLSPEIRAFLGADALLTGGKPQWGHRDGKVFPHLARSKPLAYLETVCARLGRPTTWLGPSQPDPHGESGRSTAVRLGGRESDNSIVLKQRQNTIQGGRRWRRTWRAGSWPRERRASHIEFGRSGGPPCTQRTTICDRQRGGTTSGRRLRSCPMSTVQPTPRCV